MGFCTLKKEKEELNREVVCPVNERCKKQNMNQQSRHLLSNIIIPNTELFQVQQDQTLAFVGCSSWLCLPLYAAFVLVNCYNHQITKAVPGYSSPTPLQKSVESKRDHFFRYVSKREKGGKKTLPRRFPLQFIGRITTYLCLKQSQQKTIWDQNLMNGIESIKH